MMNLLQMSFSGAVIIIAIARQWLKEHHLRRTISIRQSDTISAPLTYGIFSPVILMTKKTERVYVKDNVNGDNAFTQISAEFDDGNIVFRDYPDYWSSHLVTGDLTGNGVADVLLMRFAIGSTYGGGEFSVLHMGENGWEEYPQEFLNNSALKVEQPENFGQLSCVGASIIHKNGDTFLRIMAAEDIMEATVKCIDCSYREDGWFIEDIQLITDYYEMDREADY